MKRNRFHGEESFSRELELEAKWDGRAVLLYVDFTVTGAMTPYSRQTLLSPEEPSYFDPNSETFVLTQAVDAETDDDIELTDRVKAFAKAEAEKWVEAHRVEVEAHWSQEAADRDEAAYDAAVDAEIDRRREER